MGIHLAARSAPDRFPWVRGLLLLPLLWWTLTLGAGFAYWCFLDNVNLAFHEAGHLVFSFAGKTIHYLGGTLAQLLVPGGLAVYFLVRERKPFAAAVCVWWVGQNLINISVYMADARLLAIPLVGGGDHDWNELFYRFGLLTEPAVENISTGTHVLGTVIMIAGLAWAAYFALPTGARGRVRDGLASRLPWLESILES